MLNIGKKYCIGSDPLNVTLYEKRKSKDGKKNVLKTLGYYSSPQQALQGLVNLKVLETEFKDMATICKELDNIKGMISKLSITT